MKKDLIIEDLMKNGIFGRTVAYLEVIEWQVIVSAHIYPYQLFQYTI